MAPTKIAMSKSNKITSNHEQDIRERGELYIFDLPKPLRGALFTKNPIALPYGPSLPPLPSVESSEDIWTDNPEWIKKIHLFDQTQKFEFFRCVLPRSFGRESGLIFDKPISELRKLQRHDDKDSSHRRWTLVIFGKDKIAAIHIQTDLFNREESKPIKDRLVILKDEVKKRWSSISSAPVIESKKGHAKSKKERVVEKLSRKSQRGVDRDPVNKDPMNKAGSELLASWENELEKSELIFVGASKKQISILFPESSPLYNKLRAFPFAFGSPKIEELKRCYVKLTTAKLNLDC
ncbi:uncharacterized protein MELLADRAFT_64518 [Melampsora larici-populina 98AG31]|uniref:VLRF1 domain-containing protein n=1 Tax=Melampsora larici-populina (strain 98AG31 / pathotype 3-4-7) TaxID=747676 RepID=F4RRR1_MELLP|nr:uncharacterized protein MELLADRAFT_64518 [Melampsora larici-populina 98AG31]EGG04973.1 hypothetical protein MELLADRAFT_64518 [Melampsora larici-populina 98AG31]